MNTATRNMHPGPDSGLEQPESRLPLEKATVPMLPELSDRSGPAPLSFRLLTTVVNSGGILPSDINYDEEAQTGIYHGLPPGVFMTKNPPKTYEPTQPTGQMDAPDDPGPSDD